MTNKFKVGDRVIIKNKTYGNCSKEQVGTIQTVTFIFENCVGVSGEQGYCYNFEDLEKVEVPQGKPYHLNGKTYYAFPEGKTIKELGIDTSRKFICPEDDRNEVIPGEILEIIDSFNGDTKAPTFENNKGIEQSLWLKEVAYYDEEEVKEELKDEGTQFYDLVFTDGGKTINFKELIKPTGKKLMQSCTESIVKFAKNLGLTADEKELRQAGLQDENGNWTDESRYIVLDLEAKALNYKDFKDLYSHVDGREGACISLSPLECVSLYKKYYDKLIEIAKKFNKKDEKKN